MAGHAIRLAKNSPAPDIRRGFLRPDAQKPLGRPSWSFMLWSRNAEPLVRYSECLPNRFTYPSLGRPKYDATP